MSSSPQSSGTYFVQNQQNKEELLRVGEQDQLVTAAMGGVLAEQESPGGVHRILDVACGTGGWAIEAALAYPELTLVGIDINPNMLAVACQRASAERVDERVTFQVMDALKVLDFPDQFFDLINLRFALSFVRTWEWAGMLGDWFRLLTPRGIVRLTDENVIHQSNSPAAMRFCGLLQSALFRSGHIFTEESTGLTGHLPRLLVQQGFQNIQTRVSALQFQASTPEGQVYIQDGLRVFRTLRPFLEKWGCLPEDYEFLQSQALEELSQPDFAATWQLVTVWGMKPEG